MRYHAHARRGLPNELDEEGPARAFSFLGPWHGVEQKCYDTQHTLPSEPMHTHRLSAHPNVVANTDGGQVDGAFYLHAPMDYAVVSATPPEVDTYVRPFPGHAEIVFLMERVRDLAEENGKDDDILTLEGPDAEHSRLERDTLDWFEGKHSGEIRTHRVQVMRGDLRQFWVWKLIPELIERIEALGSRVGEGRDGEIVQLLNALHAKTGEDCLELHQREHLDDKTDPHSGMGSSLRL